MTLECVFQNGEQHPGDISECTLIALWVQNCVIFVIRQAILEISSPEVLNADSHYELNVGKGNTEER